MDQQKTKKVLSLNVNQLLSNDNMNVLFAEVSNGITQKEILQQKHFTPWMFIADTSSKTLEDIKNEVHMEVKKPYTMTITMRLFFKYVCAVVCWAKVGSAGKRAASYAAVLG